MSNNTMTFNGSILGDNNIVSNEVTINNNPLLHETEKELKEILAELISSVEERKQVFSNIEEIKSGNKTIEEKKTILRRVLLSIKKAGINATQKLAMKVLETYLTQLPSLNEIHDQLTPLIHQAIQ